jgi:TRAP-type mannitol/chloroaromatic compound transport system permease large subunit
VLDFLEIIYIVIPIVGPGDLWRHARSGLGDDHDRGEPADVVPDAALRLRAVLSARGGAAAGDDGHIYRGVLPFVGIQVIGAGLLLWLFPGIVTILPDLLCLQRRWRFLR